MEDFWIWLTLLLTGGGALVTVGLPLCMCGAGVLAAGVVGVVIYRAAIQPAQAAQRAAQAWPETTGVVLSSEVSTESTYDSTSSGYTTTFKPLITYEFEVNGVRYRSDQRRASESVLSAGMLPGSVQSVVNRYPAGAPVTVYYNPANPHESVLER